MTRFNHPSRHVFACDFENLVRNSGGSFPADMPTALMQTAEALALEMPGGSMVLDFGARVCSRWPIGSVLMSATANIRRSKFGSRRKENYAGTLPAHPSH